MYNMNDSGKSLAPYTISEYFNDIIEKDDEVQLDDLDNFADSFSSTRYIQFQRQLYLITFGVILGIWLTFFFFLKFWLRDMVNIIRSTYCSKLKDNFSQNIALYDHWTKYRVSRAQFNTKCYIS